MESLLDEKKDCCICYCIMVEPVTLKCSHSFCAYCLKQSMNVNKNACPLCRKKITQPVSSGLIDRKMQQRLADAYPKEFEKREKELTKAGFLIGDQIDLCFTVGNKWRQLTKYKCNNKGTPLDNEWTSYVDF